jgi:cytochrome oxidase Cu insertion factor (SCO1/SenC/PrrC family)
MGMHEALQTGDGFMKHVNNRSVRVALAGVAVMMLAACSAPAATPATQAPQPTAAPAMEKPVEAMATEMPVDAMAGAEVMTKTDAVMDDSAAVTETHAMGSTDAMTQTDAMMEKPGEAMVDAAMLPAWQKVQLMNARTGEAFTLADFNGKTVFVEPFATWCSNCRAQLKNVKAARVQLDDQNVFVALSVETNISPEAVAKYTTDQGFDWVFAVMTPEMLKQLTDQFGLTVANPPSTPHFIIRPDGTVTDLSTGIKGVDAIVAELQAVAQ